MSDQSSAEDVVLPFLYDSDIVYRLAGRRSDIDPDSNTFLPIVFQLRDRDRNTGLSVFIAKNCPFEYAKVGAGEMKCYGVAELNVGEIRALGLEVQPDRQIHANIIGLPYKDDDLEKATTLAYKLAEIAVVLWVKP